MRLCILWLSVVRVASGWDWCEWMLKVISIECHHHVLLLRGWWGKTGNIVVVGQCDDDHHHWRWKWDVTVVVMIKEDAIYSPSKKSRPQTAGKKENKDFGRIKPLVNKCMREENGIILKANRMWFACLPRVKDVFECVTTEGCGRKRRLELMPTDLKGNVGRIHLPVVYTDWEICFPWWEYSLTRN